MARALKLNVYVTPAGFFDAVVAAPNQRAALEAWGAHADLFGQKLAGPEPDEAWRDKALASPGEVLKKPRGNAAELLAKPKPDRVAPTAEKAAPRPPPPPPKPRPDRSLLEAAEAALDEARERLEQTRSAFARRRAALEEEERRAILTAEQEAQKAEVNQRRKAAAFARASR
ncbi:MAG: hypothetical protein INR64_15005 [Caulobacteraceae bacterium]|nr:hypothetical protein [Caulobacter sp.]